MSIYSKRITFKINYNQPNFLKYHTQFNILYQHLKRGIPQLPLWTLCFSNSISINNDHFVKKFANYPWTCTICQENITRTSRETIMSFNSNNNGVTQSLNTLLSIERINSLLNFHVKIYHLCVET